MRKTNQISKKNNTLGNSKKKTKKAGHDSMEIATVIGRSRGADSASAACGRVLEDRRSRPEKNAGVTTGWDVSGASS